MKTKSMASSRESVGRPEQHLDPPDRRYWAETTGIEFIEQFGFIQDVDSIKMSVDGELLVCCFAAASEIHRACF